MRILYLAAAAAAIAAWFLRTRLVLLFLGRHAVARATPKAPSDCGMPAYPAAINAPTAASPAVVLNAADTGGFITGSTISLPQGTDIRITSRLTLVAFGDVTLDGKLATALLAPGSRSVDLIIVSLQGDITVGPAGKVGDGSGPDGAPDTVTTPIARASAGAGSAGGLVKLIAPLGSIIVEGELRGQWGGFGGKAIADPGPIAGGRIGGYAAATGGEAGEGGDLRLCACESIRILGTVIGGGGGDGGPAVSYAQNGWAGEAEGGPGNTAGFIYFTGLAAAPVSVVITGSVTVATGGWGGDVDAYGGAGATSGGSAKAIGGHGGAGASVEFWNCVVTPPFGTVQSSLGGDGGGSDAWGGDGDWARVLQGWRGGDANASGGNGGPTGQPNPPVIPTPTGFVVGTPAAATRVTTAKGGNGTAVGGTGGNGGTSATYGFGGFCGNATAAAGLGGITQTSPPPVTLPGIMGGPAPGGAGRAATVATVTGTP